MASYSVTGNNETNINNIKNEYSFKELHYNSDGCEGFNQPINEILPLPSRYRFFQPIDKTNYIPFNSFNQNQITKKKLVTPNVKVRNRHLHLSFKKWKR